MDASHRLLVIDDSSTIRKLVELSFRGAPFTLDFATTGAEGIAKGLLGPDVILLDCVLPDMKAADVCQRLTEDPRGRGARVILMSAKDREALRGTFERFPQVIDFVGKPFSADEVVGRIRAAVAQHPAAARPEAEASAPAPAAAPAPHLAIAPAAPHHPAAAVAAVSADGPSGLGPKETEAAAKALYARLARPLGSVPEWLRQAQTGVAPASVPAFIARKLLTPELVSSLLDALLPFYKQALRVDGAARPGDHADGVARDPDEGAPLRGQLAGWSLTELLTFVGQAARTGELILTPATGPGAGPASDRLLVLWDSGEIVACTSFDPLDYAREVDVDLSGVAADARTHAESEQRAHGTPLYVTLAEAGLLSPSLDVGAILHERGVRLLRKACGVRSLKYVWRDRPSLPAYAVTWGRHLSLSDDLQAADGAAVHPTEPTIAQLSLERLRRPSAWGEVDARLPSGEQTFDRAFGFSHKLRSLRLTASEQRVLAAVDRQASVRALTQRLGLPAREVARILYRLAEIDLIQALSLPGPAASSSSSSPAGAGAGEAPARSVMILDPDDGGFCQPLREMLARRPRPVPLLDLMGELDVTDAISRERPGLVVLNETTARGKLEEIARAVRAAPHLAGTALAAVLEPETTASPDSLVAAGFDAVWTKPVHYLELVALLAAEPPSAPSPFSQSLPPSRT